MDNIVYQMLVNSGMTDTIAQGITYGMTTVVIIALTLLATWFVQNKLFKAVVSYIEGNRYNWDDAFIKYNVFQYLSWYVPIIICYLAQDLLLPTDHPFAVVARRIILTGFVIVTIRCAIALLNSTNEIYGSVRKGKTPIRGYIDVAKIITYIMGGIFILAILTNRSPWGLLSVLGGLTAITMLVFKDSILGFVASVQLTGTDMVRIGDWIEMPSYGADGDVIDISIHSVKVQNWDKTITTIPTYALIANSFKNWRGMSDSGGRRIKRSLNIDMHSIRFVTDVELQQFSKIMLLNDYLQSKQHDLEQFNREHQVDTSVLINGRRQTNMGIFRAYVVAYLKNNPQIHQDMTFLVRQLQPNESGLPLEIYVFSQDQVWANYEAIQADIFDHIIAALPQFDLRVYQSPSGFDFRYLATSMTPENKIGP